MQTVYMLVMTTCHLAFRVHEHLHLTITSISVTEHPTVSDSCTENSNINSFNIIRKCDTKYETKIDDALQFKKIIDHSTSN